MASEQKKCGVCGETDPYPAWFCMFKATGDAQPGKPLLLQQGGAGAHDCQLAREGYFMSDLDKSLCIVADLYSSEINFQITAFFDAGFTVRLGDEMNGFVDEANKETFEQAVAWLMTAAIKTYPNSDFAGIYSRTPARKSP